MKVTVIYAAGSLGVELVYTFNHLSPLSGIPACPVGIYLGHQGNGGSLVSAASVINSVFFKTREEGFRLCKVLDDKLVVLHHALCLGRNLVVVSALHGFVSNERNAKFTGTVAVGNEEMVVGPEEEGFSKGAGLYGRECTLLAAVGEPLNHPVAAVHCLCVNLAESIQKGLFLTGVVKGCKGIEVPGAAPDEVVAATLLPIDVTPYKALLREFIVAGRYSADGVTVRVEEVAHILESLSLDIKEFLT